MTRQQVGLARKSAGLFFRAPDPKVSAALILPVSALFAFYPSGHLSLTVFLAFSFSALASAELSVYVIGLKRSHSYFMTMASFLVAGVLAAAAGPFFAAFFLAFLVAFRSAWFRAISGPGFFRSLLPGGIQSLLLIGSINTLQPEIPLLLLLIIASLVLVEALAWYSGVPLRKVFGVGLLELSRLVFSNVNSGSSEIERIFVRNAKKIKTPVSVVGLRGKKGMKAMIVAPFIHPGPFSGAGSADLPQRACSALSRRFGCEVFFAKGGGTHDTNLVHSGEIEHVAKKACGIAGSLKFSRACTFFRRHAGAFGVRFGNTVLGISTQPAEDVEFDAGKGFLDAMRAYAKNAIYIEAHSSFTGRGYPVSVGSREYSGMVQALGAVSRRLGLSKQYSFSAGVARVFPGLSASDGLGPGGVGVLLFKVKAKRFAVIFVDSNSIAAGVRENIVCAVRARGVSDVEVVSSDSHQFATLIERENPFGKADALLDACLEGLELAEANLEPCTIGAASDSVDVSVFGDGASARILTAVNQATMRFSLAATASVAALLLAGAAI